MPFRLSIHNLMGIWDANLDVEGVTLIAGPNGSGKTSILEAAASAMSGHGYLHGFNGPGALRNSKLAGGGGVEVRFAKGSRCIMWPGGEITEKGSPPRSSPVTTGAVPFFSLAESGRVAEVGKRVRMEPSPDDVRRALVGFAGVDPATGPQILAAASEHGWDALHAEAEKQLAAEIASWEQLVGESYDREKARGWHPASIEPGLDYRLVDFDVEVMAIERRLLDRQAIEKVDRIAFDEIVTAAERMPAAQRGLNEAQKAVAVVEQEIGDLEAKLAEYEGREGEVRQASCPCCGEPIAVALMRGKHQSWHLSDRPMGAGKKSPLLVDRTKKAIARAQVRRAAAGAALADAQAERDRCVDADTALRAMSRPADDDRPVDQLLEALKGARARRDDFRRWLRAKELQRAIASSAVLERAMSPRGIRKKLLNDALLEINRMLVGLCDQADLPKIVMLGTGDCTIDGKSYHVAAESGRWTAEVMVRIAFALVEGSTFTTVPSLHTLQPSGRPPFFRMLKGTGLDVLVELTPKDRQSVPDLHRARIGQAYWIAGGNVEPL